MLLPPGPAHVKIQDIFIVKPLHLRIQWDGIWIIPGNLSKLNVLLQSVLLQMYDYVPDWSIKCQKVVKGNQSHIPRAQIGVFKRLVWPNQQSKTKQYLIHYTYMIKTSSKS